MEFVLQIPYFFIILPKIQAAPLPDPLLRPFHPKSDLMNKLAAILISLVTFFAITAMAGSPIRKSPEDAVRTDGEIDNLLRQLDSVLAKSPDIVRDKEARIAARRGTYASALDEEHRYWAAADLYEEYSTFDSDSALHYADLALSHARALDRRDLMAEMELNRSYIFSATGLLEEADRSLNSVKPDSLSSSLALKYCDRLLFLSTHRDLYIGVRHEKEFYSLRVDSIVQSLTSNIPPTDPVYGWLIGWKSLNYKTKVKDAIPVLKKAVDGSTHASRADAMNAWMLAKLYERTGDQHNHFKYLLISAIADAQACNKEIASLEEVSDFLYRSGDLDRANAYINYCIAAANEYKSRVRIGKLAERQKNILDAIHRRSQDQARANTRFIWALALILLALVGATLYILKQNRLLRASRESLNEANGALSIRVDELTGRVDELSAVREELHSAIAELSDQYESARHSAGVLAEDNETRDSYIANVFAICSDYIDKIDEFRVNLHKLLSQRQFDKVMSIVKSPELSAEELKKLYNNFDTIFLKMYPDFVEDFNSLLRPEERIELKTPGRLTNELRIYALVRLGLNDSVRIARFLHCKSQSVYNARQRMRKKAIIPREEFADAVRNLGKATV